MKNKILSFSILAAFLCYFGSQTKAEGISVDAGLTPAQDRIVVRLQYRNMLMQMGDNDIVMYMMPVVVAYGLTPDITVMLRNIYRSVGYKRNDDGNGQSLDGSFSDGESEAISPQYTGLLTWCGRFRRYYISRSKQFELKNLQSGSGIECFFPARALVIRFEQCVRMGELQYRRKPAGGKTVTIEFGRFT